MKVLIVRAGRTGDMVMMTPALTALVRMYPDAEFTFLTSPDGQRTLGDFSDRITRFWIYNRENPFSFNSRGSLKKKIADGSFDQIYCFEHNPSYHRLLGKSRAQVHGFPKEVGCKHYCDLLLDVVFDGEKNKNERNYISLPVNAQAKSKTLETLGNLGITEGTFLLAIHPTFSGAGKRFRTNRDKKNKLWPPNSFSELASRLREYAKHTQIDLRMMMNLMPNDYDYGKKIIECGSGNLEIYCPNPNFQDYKAFLQRADLLVTPDTGPMHIASAVGTKVVALFSGRDPGNCGPFVRAEQVKVLSAEETNGSKTGIAAIPVDDVYNACIKIIG